MRKIYPVGTFVWNNTVGLGMVSGISDKWINTLYHVYYFGLERVVSLHPYTVEEMVETYMRKIE